MTKITPETLRGAAYAHLGIPRAVCHTRTHYFHRREKLDPLKAAPGSVALDAVRGVFKRAHKAEPIAQPTDKRRRGPRSGSLATIGGIIASK